MTEPSASSVPESAPSHIRRAVTYKRQSGIAVLLCAVALAAGFLALRRDGDSPAESPIRDSRDGCARFYALSIKTIHDQPLATYEVTTAHRRLLDAARRGGDFQLANELDQLVAAKSRQKLAEQTGAIIGRCVGAGYLTYDQMSAFADELISRAG